MDSRPGLNAEDQFMVMPSGIILPGDQPLPLREVARGLHVVENAYQCEMDYFISSPPQEDGQLPADAVVVEEKR